MLSKSKGGTGLRIISKDFILFRTSDAGTHFLPKKEFFLLELCAHCLMWFEIL